MHKLDHHNILLKTSANVYWKNKDSVYLGCNETVAKMFNLQFPHEIVGKTDYDFTNSTEYVKQIIANDKMVLEEKQEKTFEEVWVNRDGQSFIYLSKKKILEIDGKIIGTIGVSIDITDSLDKNSKSVKELNNYLQRIVESVGGSVYWKNKQGKYLGCNTYAAKMAGLEKSENIIGKTDYDLFNKSEADEFRENDLQVIKYGQELLTEEVVVSPAGINLTQLSIKKPLYNQEGMIVGIIGNTIDITERKKIEQELILAKEKAEIANNAKTEFLRNMRHDFRTPFSGILGMANILYDEETDSTKKEGLNSIIKSSKVLLEQLNEITDFISLEDGHIAILEKQFDLYKVIEDIEKLLFPVVYAKKLKFHVTIGKELPKYIIGDQMRTQRVLLNLLTNSVKFTNAGHVLLEASVAKEESSRIIIKFKINDTGIGIPKEEQDVIFEKFSRLTPSYTGIYKGKGLGLRIVKQFLDELNGEIHVTSQLNKGSTFIILIPYKLPLLNCNEQELLMDKSQF